MRTSFFLFCLLCPSFAWAVPQPIIGSTNVTLDATGTEVTCPMTREGISATSTFCLVPAAGTFNRLQVVLPTAPDNGAGTQSFSFTIQTGNPLADTAITCSISETATSCTDQSNSVAFSAGDRIAIEVTPTNTPAVGQARWVMQFTPTTAGQNIWMGATDGVWSTTANNYGGLMRFAPTATEDDRYSIFGKSCVASALYIEQATDPTNVGSSYLWTVRDCGAYTAPSCAGSALACTVSAGGTTCNDTSGFTVDAEDVLTLESDPSATAPVDPDKVSWGMRCDMVDTQAFNMNGATNVNLTTSTTYIPINSLDVTTDTTEATHFQYTHELIVTGLWVWMSADPGTVNVDAYSWTVRDDGADTACTLTITANNTTGEITTCTDVIRNLSAIDLEITPISTPSVQTMDTAWGVSFAYRARNKVLVE